MTHRREQSSIVNRQSSIDQPLLLSSVRAFVEKEVLPVASQLEHEDAYPFDLVERMKDMGLFGAIIPEEYGGLGLDFSTYVMVVEEICRGWMSLSGVFNTHLIMAHIVEVYGTDEQKRHFLPAFASGEKRGGLALTESQAGSDLQAIAMTATRDGNSYVLDGTKMFITNGRYGNAFAVLVKTDPRANPAHKGISLFIVEKGDPGFTVGKNIEKLGYKGVETVELIFDRVVVPAENLVGLEEGQGFRQVMAGLEVGRINIAARAVGVARAAFEDAIKYAQQRHAFGKPIAEHQAIQLKLAEMATRIEAARLLVANAAQKKDRGDRCDLEAGMAKLYASEICQEVSLEAMRILGGYGYTREFNVERYYRDAPLLIIGEGTNEIQKLVIARNLLKKYAL
jgi:alkylation response protein AidB-like acyl-CoA dehydrogenase